MSSLAAAPMPGLALVGKLRCYGRCSRCSRGWSSDGLGPPLCACGLPQPAFRGPGNPRPGDCYIDLPLDGEQHIISADEQRRGFAWLARVSGLGRMDRWRCALTTLHVVRGRLAAGAFFAGAFRRRPPAEFLLERIWLDWKQEAETSVDETKRRKPGYIAQLGGYARHHLAELFALDVREVLAPKLLELLEQLEKKLSQKTGRRLHRKTLSNIFGFVRRLLTAAAQLGRLRVVPAFPTVAWEEPAYRTYSWREIELVLEQIRQADLPLFTLLAETPIRPSEARAAKVGDFDPRGRRLWIGKTFSRGILTNRRKAGPGYWTYLEPRSLRLIAAMLRTRERALCRPLGPEEHLFVTSPGQGRRISGRPYSHHIRDTWRRACGRTEVEYRTLYALKHSFGRDAVDFGLRVSEEIAPMMGLANDKSAKRYAKGSPEVMRRSMHLVQEHRRRTSKVQASS